MVAGLLVQNDVNRHSYYRVQGIAASFPRGHMTYLHFPATAHIPTSLVEVDLDIYIFKPRLLYRGI